MNYFISVNYGTSSIIKKWSDSIKNTCTDYCLVIVDNFYSDEDCKGNFKKEVFPTLNRRIVLPFFIPLIALIVSLLLIKTKKKLFFNNFSIFGYSFIILLYAELIIRFTGKNLLITNFFVFSPFVLSIMIYAFIKYKFSKEASIDE